MGNRLFDQYTYLHFSVGILSYFWGINLVLFLTVHTLFEIIENSKFGMHIINNYMFFWPGGKPVADTYINILGDTIGGYVGWLSAFYLDQIGGERGWYLKHLNY